MASEEERALIVQEYTESIFELQRQTKPSIIKSLAIVAEDNVENGSLIVGVIEKGIFKVNNETK